MSTEELMRKMRYLVELGSRATSGPWVSDGWGLDGVASEIYSNDDEAFIVACRAELLPLLAELQKLPQFRRKPIFDPGQS